MSEAPIVNDIGMEDSFMLPDPDFFRQSEQSCDEDKVELSPPKIYNSDRKIRANYS